jgi:hypothetical protein
MMCPGWVANDRTGLMAPFLAGGQCDVVAWCRSSATLQDRLPKELTLAGITTMAVPRLKRVDLSARRHVVET